MSQLAEFLREHADRRKADQPAREAERADWVGAVISLLMQIEGWIAAANTDRILVCDRYEAWISEQGLGRYKVPGLRIEFEGEQVHVAPRGRGVLAFIRESPTGPEARARGRVDVTNHRLTFPLLRAPDGDRHHWYLYDDLTGLSKPLTREVFEAVLVSLLK